MTESSPWKLDSSHGVKSSFPEPRCFNQRRLPYFWALLTLSAAGMAPTDNPWQHYSCFLSCQSHLNSQSSLHSFLPARAEGRWLDSSVIHPDCRTVHLFNVECFLTVPLWVGTEVGGQQHSRLLGFFWVELKNKLLGLHQENQPQLRNP